MADQKKKEERRKKERLKDIKQQSEQDNKNKQELQSQQKQQEQAEQFCFDADCLFFGFGKLENNSLASQLYEKSAELGNPKAMMALGRIHEFGLGTKSDIMKAYYYYD